jgi:multifunctional methyltransferase subunit TRM112
MNTSEQKSVLLYSFLQVEVINGELVCPESGRKFAINKGIPNMLLNEDEL